MDQPGAAENIGGHANKGRRRLRRAAVGLCVLGLGAVIGAEVVGRVGYGLGDPPLFIRDAQIEYLYKPSSSYRYRHHDVRINGYSMRSGDFPAKKSAADELRVMVIGDSLIAGGGKIDQGELATERMRALLAAQLKRPVVVGNISAPSWGPPNQLAYVKRFGLFDADVVVLVLNSGDVDDVPGLERLGSSWPETKPLLALQEPGARLVERLAPRLAERLGVLSPASSSTSAPPTREQRVEQARLALAELIGESRKTGASVGAIQYWGLRELPAAADGGHEVLLKQLEQAGVPVWQTSEGPSRFGPESGLFLDGVHPSAAGNQRLGAILAAAVEELVAKRPGATSENR